MKILITASMCAAALALTMPSAHAAGDPAAGAKKAATCFACHGQGGNAVVPMYPKLAGQYESYIAQALREYRSGQRNNPIMKGFAGQLSDEDIADLAAYFSMQKGTLDTLKDHIQGAGK